ncbi:general stress protein [Salipaludibacillus keqinensis]|uniref:General stress protein n=1 Tax=Salipaludibacillus keqinensis TaxID=2045207 RepID=A0A323TH89_9BACI|nr:YjzC family protein [Salipaludibacillus keqinensis]PYZ91953.1 general stress protein [Salipaludibacillus keqinensis]
MTNRYKTGEKAPENGTYKFDGLTDGRKKSNATDEEAQIELKNGQTFPPLRSSQEAAYWKKKN